MLSRIAMTAGVLLLSAVTGCSNIAERVAAQRAAFANGQYELADEGFAQLAVDDDDNAPIYALDRAMVQLALGNPKRAEQLLTQGKDYLDRVTDHNPLEWFGAMLLDDTFLEYLGEDYEHIVLRAMLALANLVGDGGDVDAYAHQVVQKQQEIIESFNDEELLEAGGQNPKAAYKLVGFGAYLRAILAERDPLSIDLARREFANVVKLEPAYRDGPLHVQRVTDGQHSAKGNGVVHVLALVGRGPIKVETHEPVTGLATVIAQVVWAQKRGRATIPTITSVPIPTLQFRSDNPTEAWVSVDGEEVGSTATVTDVDATARQQFELLRPWIIARAAIRRAFKIASVEVAKEVVNPRDESRKNNPDRRRRARARNDAADLLLSGVALLWTGMESADTRCWGLLPSAFQALRVECPAGERDITIRAGRGGMATGRPQTVRVTVRDGYDTFVVVQVPTTEGGPEPLTSRGAVEPVDASLSPES